MNWNELSDETLLDVLNTIAEAGRRSENKETKAMLRRIWLSGRRSYRERITYQKMLEDNYRLFE